MLDYIKSAAEVQAEKADQERKADRANALRYLAETDWYVIRAQEMDEPLPKEIAKARAKARIAARK